MKCRECGEERQGEFYPHCKTLCKACKKKHQTVLNRQPKNKERQARYYKQWYAERGRKRKTNYADVILLWQSKHPDGVKAKQKVQQAIKKGLLKRPMKCAFCGNVGRMNGHHEDYNFPYNVIWLCSSCHKKLHLEYRT